MTGESTFWSLKKDISSLSCYFLSILRLPSPAMPDRCKTSSQSISIEKESTPIYAIATNSTNVNVKTQNEIDSSSYSPDIVSLDKVTGRNSSNENFNAPTRGTQTGASSIDNGGNTDKIGEITASQNSTEDKNFNQNNENNNGATSSKNASNIETESQNLQNFTDHFFSNGNNTGFESSINRSELSSLSGENQSKANQEHNISSNSHTNEISSNENNSHLGYVLNENEFEKFGNASKNQIEANFKNTPININTANQTENLNDNKFNQQETNSSGSQSIININNNTNKIILNHTSLSDTQSTLFLKINSTNNSQNQTDANKETNNDISNSEAYKKVSNDSNESDNTSQTSDNSNSYANGSSKESNSNISGDNHIDRPVLQFLNFTSILNEHITSNESNPRLSSINHLTNISQLNNFSKFNSSTNFYIPSSGIAFSCPSAHGLYPCPFNCSLFYMCCTDRPYLMRCPTKLYFDPVKRICSWSQNVVCKLTLSPQSSEVKKPMNVIVDNLVSNEDISSSNNALDNSSNTDDNKTNPSTGNSTEALNNPPGTFNSAIYSSNGGDITVPTAKLEPKHQKNKKYRTRLGIFVDPLNCRMFYMSGADGMHHMKCPSNLKFDPKTKVCNWPHLVECDS